MVLAPDVVVCIWKACWPSLVPSGMIEGTTGKLGVVVAVYLVEAVSTGGGWPKMPGSGKMVVDSTKDLEVVLMGRLKVIS